MDFAPIEEIIKDIKRGRMVILADDESRENEGDIVMAAQFATPEKVNFIVKEARGLLCSPLSTDLAGRLDLFPMGRDLSSPGGDNSDPYRTAWTISVDAKKGVATGISAADRSRTLKALASPSSAPADFTRPGHVFPLRAKPGGVLIRAGHTEACVDLLNLAGLRPAGVICEIMRADGTMARLPHLKTFARRHRLKLATIADLIKYRRGRETLVERHATASLPTPHGIFVMHIYREKITGLEHIALVRGEPGPTALVRVHSECLTGDVFGSRRCDCGEQLDAAQAAIAKEGSGILLYMRQEGRGIGLGNKIKAYALQDKGYDTVSANLALGFPADLRDYGTGAQILSDLGVRRLRLLTNNPRKLAGLGGYGLKIAARVPLIIRSNAHNKRYLATKAGKLGHLIV
ncbi:MAG: 3 4-dihydroxy 2-butanone 4-phosphate synthase / GTP cyclohydrolase II [Elusimicrobia bacterium]|nr:MAG: 3 4-dihydroxy 2-butanone 4-phosphate synthase / GTP cyclohydrolase II [Elusimicrobiota bacterium]KAF0158380.1 MAG: 3 4-dihydroxy 2-butanone 4-phosphate synthase / GTP cyclohydrolase II [Elusimicrobiota bacterium]